MSCRWPRDREASRPRFSPSSASSVWFFVRSSSTMPFGRAEVLTGCDEHGRGGHREHEDSQESQAMVREHDAGGQNAVDHVMRREPGGGLLEDGERTSPLGDGRRGDDEGDVDHVVGETRHALRCRGAQNPPMPCLVAAYRSELPATPARAYVAQLYAV